MSSLRSEQSLTGRLIAKGRDGKSAYDYARLGGYEGSEEEFIELLTREIPSKLSDLEGPLPEDCKPDWDEKDDMSSAFIKNKPFYEETTVSSKDILITWDGNTTDRVTATIAYNGRICAYKVSNEIVTYDQLLKMEMDTASESGIKVADWFCYDADGAVTVGELGFASVSIPGTYTIPGCGKYTYPETGIYFPEDYRALRTIDPLISTEITIKKIDEKFIPDTVARGTDLEKETVRAKTAEASLKNDLEKFSSRDISYNSLTDTPCHMKIIKETIVDECTLNIPDYQYDRTSFVEPNNGQASLIDGDEYEIVVNGKSYTCTPSDSGELRVSLDETSVSTFCVSVRDPSKFEVGPMDYNSAGYLDGEYTFKLMHRAEDAVPLNEIFLPETTKYQNDWNESDSSKSGFIKNKPFGEETSEVEVIPETKVTVSTQGSRSYGKLTGINTSILSFDTSYTVEFDGTKYEIISVSDTLTGGACLGNRIGEDDGYSFGIIDDADGYSPAGEEGVYLFADAGEHTIRVYTKKITIIPLEEKYMPDHNHSWFDLSDKPFGDLDLEYLYNGPITVNNTTTSFTMNKWFDGNYKVKAILSDITGMVVYETEGKSVSALRYDAELATFDDVHFPISEITMTDKTSITYTATFRESMSGEYILKLYRAGQQTIQYLEDRYLSSNIVRKEDLSNISHDMLKDRPFYRDEILTSIIQQSTTSITIHDNGIGTQFTELNSQARGEYLQDEDRLIAGVLYKVTINDLSYELTAYTNEQINHTVLGNAALINSSYSTQNQLPFVFYTGPGMVYMQHETPGTYEVGIYGLEINLKQIDPRVIPEDYINKLIDAKLAALNSNTTTN